VPCAPAEYQLVKRPVPPRLAEVAVLGKADGYSLAGGRGKNLCHRCRAGRYAAGRVRALLRVACLSDGIEVFGVAVDIHFQLARASC
jgi:hypothetical protein